jgi:hypothetical protein
MDYPPGRANKRSLSGSEAVLPSNERIETGTGWLVWHFGHKRMRLILRKIGTRRAHSDVHLRTGSKRTRFAVGRWNEAPEHAFLRHRVRSTASP